MYLCVRCWYCVICITGNDIHIHLTPHIKRTPRKTFYSNWEEIVVCVCCCCCWFFPFVHSVCWYPSFSRIIIRSSMGFMCSTKHINHKPLSTLLHSTTRHTQKKSFSLLSVILPYRRLNCARFFLICLCYSLSRFSYITSLFSLLTHLPSMDCFGLSD